MSGYTDIEEIADADDAFLVVEEAHLDSDGLVVTLLGNATDYYGQFEVYQYEATLEGYDPSYVGDSEGSDSKRRNAPEGFPLDSDQEGGRQRRSTVGKLIVFPPHLPLSSYDAI